MFKELYKSQKQLPRSEMLRFPEYIDQTTRTFDTIVDFLRDPERFPNREVNDLMRLGWRLIGTKRTPVVMDQWGVPSLTFAVVGTASEKSAMFILPTNFIDLVRENPAMQIGAMTFGASQARDYYSGRIESDGSEIVKQRARAFESETLQTLDRLAQNEGMHLAWNPYQQKILQEFPRGLEDLPEDLRYQTPPYLEEPPIYV